MSDRTPNEIGEDLENKTERILGGRRVPQSGGGKFWKLDVRGGRHLIVSCKATGKHHLRVTKGMLIEAQQAARGFQGTGDSVMPGLVTDVDGEACLLMRLEDAGALFQMEPDERAHIPSTKAQNRRAQARRGIYDG